MPLRPAALLLALAPLAIGCATAGDYVWVDSALLSRPRGDAEVIIAPGDVLMVRVFGQEALSTRALVRDDGQISLPMVGDQVAEGLGPATLAQLLTAQYQTYLKNPILTVVLEQRHDFRVSVIGAVATPGSYILSPGDGVLQALAMAGGITPFAHRDRIFVLRRADPGRPAMRVRFRYQALLAAEPRAAAFDLRNTDVVVVE
jgi:polysaccharide export outer membrane protein